MESLYVVPFLFALFSLLAPPASAALVFSAGDGLAIVLAVVIGIVVTCAILGFIARRRANN